MPRITTFNAIILKIIGLSSFFQAINKFDSEHFFLGFSNTIPILGLKVKPLLEELPMKPFILCKAFLVFNWQPPGTRILKI
jgi:hypothetical protein